MRYKVYGQKVRELRKEKGISQRNFAQIVDISYMSLRRLEDKKFDDEKGLSQFRIDVQKIKDIANTLETTVENLLSEETKSTMYSFVRAEKSLTKEVREYVRKEHNLDIQDEQIIPFLFFIIRSKK
jgi:transcriptional regulator with XRE-family HTH domain